MKLSKIFHLDCAHFLPHYKGKCEMMHGHTYKVIVTVEGPVDEKTGLVMDFAEMKEIFMKEVDEKLDHKLLNDVMENPSAENLAVWIWKALENKMPLSKITIYENESSFVEYEGK